MINEISPHLPVYLWGPPVERVLEAAQRGFMLLATAHADSVHDLVRALTGSPLHIRAAQIAAFELVVVLERDEEKQSGRRVRERLATRANPGWCYPRAAPFAPATMETTYPMRQHYVTQTQQLWFPKQELARRRHILEDLRDRRIAQLPIGVCSPTAVPETSEP